MTDSILSEVRDESLERAQSIALAAPRGVEIIARLDSLEREQDALGDELDRAVTTARRRYLIALRGETERAELLGDVTPGKLRAIDQLLEVYE